MSSPPSLTRLWASITSALSRLRASIPPLDVLTNKERHGLRASLRALELFCRRLAIVEALNLPPLSAQPVTARTKPTPKPARRKRRPSLRLWPKPRPMPVRITMLGRATSMREIWRDQKRAALVARLALARKHKKPAHVRLADRIDALQRFLDAPSAALRRLARKLRRTPKLGLTIAARRAPPCHFLAQDDASECEGLCWSALANTS